MFKKYQHVERFGNSEVENIHLGECYVFPKIDGTNGSIWFEDGKVQAGSRRRHLTLESDNAGFYEWVLEQENLKEFFKAYPDVRLFGEWLVPHSLKTYREDSWRKFYVFDFVVDREESELTHSQDEKFDYIQYGTYQPILDSYGIDYIPPIATINNGSYEQFINQLKHNVFLIEDGKGVGEGIVIKNYNYRNKYGRQTWAKIVTSEFKEKHAKEMGGHALEGKKMVEEDIVSKYVTKALVDKEFAKIKNESGWNSKDIPRLFSTVFYCLVSEESWNFVKEFKKPKIDFNTLNYLTISKVKELKPELF